MMMKKIWILTQYETPPQYTIHARDQAMSKYLTQAGYDVTIFGSSFLHHMNVNLITDGSLFIEREYDTEDFGRLKFIHVNASSYSGNGLSRKTNLLLYPWNLYRCIKKRGEKPDCIINDLRCMALDFPYRIAKRCGAPIVTQVRDLWPESIVSYGYMKRKSPLAKFLYRVERQGYLKSDAIVYTMRGWPDYIRNQNWEGKFPMEKARYINNGVDLEVFRRNRERFVLDDPDLDDPTTFKVVYTGSVRTASSLGLLLDAAKAVRNKRVKFLIWGDGDELPGLRKRVAEEGIENVRFKGRVEKKYIPSIVGRADLNIAHNMPSDVIRLYGISFNKVFDYLAAEKPVLSDFPCNYNPAVEWNAGTSVDEPTPENVAREVERFAELDAAQYQTYCDNARKAAEEFDCARLMKKMIRLIESLDGTAKAGDGK